MSKLKGLISRFRDLETEHKPMIDPDEVAEWIEILEKCAEILDETLFNYEQLNTFIGGLRGEIDNIYSVPKFDEVDDK